VRVRRDLVEAGWANSRFESHHMKARECYKAPDNDPCRRDARACRHADRVLWAHGASISAKTGRPPS